MTSSPPIAAASDVLTGFVALLRRCPDDAARKTLVIDACLAQALTADETELLISAMLLEAA